MEHHQVLPTRRRVLPALRLGVAAVVGAAVLALPVSTATARPQADACPAATTDDGRYVAFLYDEILLRCPDAGAASYWTAVLERGTSRWAVAEAIDTSTENLGRNNVDPLFQGLLGRAPSAAERTHWISQIRRSHENATMTAAVLASQEAYDRHTTAATATERDEEWLTYAYNRILDRAPDPQGAAHYLRRLGPSGSTAATRAAVATSLERSPSNAGSWVRAAMTEALGRTPDPAGIRHWTAWLTGPGRWQTFRLWTHLLSSDEAYRRVQQPG